MDGWEMLRERRRAALALRLEYERWRLAQGLYPTSGYAAWQQQAETDSILTCGGMLHNVALPPRGC